MPIRADSDAAALTRRGLIGASSASLVLGAGCGRSDRRTDKHGDPTTAGVRPPNILLILADDFGAELLSAYGGVSYSTPAIDALAAGSVTFTTAWATPICTPTRVQLLSGQYPFRTGWTGLIAQQGACISSAQTTLPTMLKQAGYRTCITGKWQLCRWDEHPTNLHDSGFDEAFVWSWRVGDGRPNRYWDPGIWWNETFEEAPWVGSYGPDLYADYLIDFMQQSDDRPFFAYYAMTLPHTPFLPPPSLSDVDRTLEDPAYFPHMVAYADMLIARVLDALDAAGVGDDTVVVFTGDNGTDMNITSELEDGSQIVGGKSRLTEPGLRVPLMMAWPGRSTPGVRAELVDLADLVPTIAELAGISAPPTDGKSLAGWVDPERPTPQPKSHLYGQYEDGWALRDRRWKLRDTNALFDLETDPREETPIVSGDDTPETATAREALQRAHEELTSSEPGAR